MENLINYYFKSETNEKEITQLLKQPLFHKLIAYFIERSNQEIILRQLKEHFRFEQHFEHFLDRMIDCHLIARQNRRYFLLFPIYKSHPTIQLSPLLEKLTVALKKQKITEQYYFFSEWLWSELFEQGKGNYFFGIQDAADTLIKREVGTSSLTFTSISLEKQPALNFANYFTLLSKNEELPDTFKSLEQLIGDVDYAYFISQVQKILRAVTHKKKAKDKRNIFQEAMLLTGDLTRDKSDQLLVKVPIAPTPLVVSKEQTLFLQTFKQALQTFVPLETTREQTIAFNQQLYTRLYQMTFTENYSIFYYKKKSLQ